MITREDIALIQNIVSNSSRMIAYDCLTYYFGEKGKKLLSIKALIHTDNRKQIEYEGRFYRIRHHKGKSGIFSTHSGWVYFNAECLKLYSVCMKWLIRFMQDCLKIPEHVHAKIIVPDHIWLLGSTHVNHQNVRCIYKNITTQKLL